ncbi:MAG: metal ABC transporter substrate-binding protein [Burkholderiales bacterium]|nr:metal ABC transporter substrate-binding protein [Burkholderiales bacterium]
MRTFCLLFASLFSLTALAADKLPVVASFSILGDLVAEVGGDKVAVTTLVGPDGDAHVYQPTPQDAKAVAAAKLVVVNGLGLEGWMDRLFKTSASHTQQLVASTGVPTRKGEGGKIDPHAWQDPARVRVYVQNIDRGLASADPANASVYHQRAQAFLARLTALETWADQTIAKVPSSKRRVITSHDAFGYLGARFGITFLAPQGMGTETEATAKDVGELIKQIRAEHIRAVFVENITNPRLIQQVASETHVQLGPELYSDALSKADGPAAHYEDMMRHNITALVAGMKLN